MAAEYVAQRGNLDIVLCERGIRTFETATRNTLDISRRPGRAGDQSTCRSSSTRRTRAGGATSSYRCRGRPSRSAPTASSSTCTRDPEHALCDGPQALVDADLRALAAAVRQLPRRLRADRRRRRLSLRTAKHQVRISASTLAACSTSSRSTSRWVSIRTLVGPSSADEHALLAAGGDDSRGRRHVTRTTMLVSSVAGSTDPARLGQRAAAPCRRGPRPAGRRGGRARAARPRRGRRPGACRRRAACARPAPRRSRSAEPSTDPTGAPSPLDRQTEIVSTSRAVRRRAATPVATCAFQIRAPSRCTASPTSSAQRTQPLAARRAAARCRRRSCACSRPTIAAVDTKYGPDVRRVHRRAIAARSTTPARRCPGAAW